MKFVEFFYQFLAQLAALGGAVAVAVTGFNPTSSPVGGHVIIFAIVLSVSIAFGFSVTRLLKQTNPGVKSGFFLFTFTF